MAAYTSRPYTDERDWPALTRLLSSVCTDLWPTSHWHPGNLFWEMHFRRPGDLGRDLRLWEDGEGRLLGFAWFDEPDTVDLQVGPGLDRRAEIEGEMLAWAAGRAAEARAGERDRRLRTWAGADDAPRRAHLAAGGFARDERSFVHFARALGRDLPEPAIAAGWAVRPVAGPAEFPARVELHRAVWAPSRMTPEAYERLRTVPGFRPDLDLVLVAPDGSLAAYCIAWLDSASRSGMFEPVGTRPDLQGKGLGRILLGAALRRLRDLGATAALVSTAGFNHRAIRLYEAAGFRLANRDDRYSKNLGAEEQ